MLDVGGQVAECLLGDPKVLREHVFGDVVEQVGEQKVSFSEKLPLSKTSRNSQPSSSAWMECGVTEGKFHRSPALDVVDEGAALVVDRADAAAAGEHVGPLGLLVPVQFPDRAGLEGAC
ncbi:MAG: hypothetical protein WDM88_13350 [Galbitalea sp.]